MRRCPHCSAGRKLRPILGPLRCPVCETLESAEIREAGARVLDELRAAASSSLVSEHEATAEALRLGVAALENEGRNLRRVAHVVARSLEPHRVARKDRAR